jgi:hypothetical protein
MAPSTLLLAGGRRRVGVGPAEIAVAATPLQWRTALSPGAADVPAGPNAKTATSASVAAKPVLTPIRIRPRRGLEPLLARRLSLVLIRSSPIWWGKV